MIENDVRKVGKADENGSTKITLARFDITPACQVHHEGLRPALEEAMQRAVEECELAARYPINKTAVYEIEVKLKR